MNISNENRFNDMYEVLSELGWGGFGTVFKVKSKLSNQERAIKKVNLKGNIFLKLYHY